MFSKIELVILSYRASSSPSDELRIVLYCEFLDFSILRKLPTAKIVRRCRWKIPWYRASRRAFLSSTTSTWDVTDDWCGIDRFRAGIERELWWNSTSAWGLRRLRTPEGAEERFKLFVVTSEAIRWNGVELLFKFVATISIKTERFLENCRSVEFET